MLGLANRVLAFLTNQCIVQSMAVWVVEKAGKGFKGGFRGLVILFRWDFVKNDFLIYNNIYLL